jgi:hypothetical protein
MSFDILFPRSFDLLVSKSELEELELRSPGRALRDSITPLGRLLSLDSIILALGIEPLPDYLLYGRGIRLYSDSILSLFRRGILPSWVYYSRIVSMIEVISISL